MSDDGYIISDYAITDLDGYVRLAMTAGSWSLMHMASPDANEALVLGEGMIPTSMFLLREIELLRSVVRMTDPKFHGSREQWCEFHWDIPDITIDQRDAVRRALETTDE